MADVKTPELSVQWQGSLQGKKAAVLVADGFEQSEFDGPVQALKQAGKPTAMICHGPWLLADSGMAEGRTVTSWPAIRKDLERAGATWRDEQVVKDRNLVTSRKPDDVPAFAQAVVELVAAATPAAR